MSNASRKQRGHETQNAVAAYFRDHGWPHAETAGAGRQGVDVLGLAGISCEVKARRQLALPAWLRQARPPRPPRRRPPPGRHGARNHRRLARDHAPRGPDRPAREAGYQ